MAKKSSFLNMTLVLWAICFACSAVLGIVYAITAEPINKANIAKTNAAIAMVVPEFDNTPSQDVVEIELDGKLYKVYCAKSADQIVGYAIESYSTGFGGPIRLMVGVTMQGLVYNTSIISHTETPGLGDKIDPKKSAFSEQFQNLDPAQTAMKVVKDGGQIDAITAATISSRAYIVAVENALKVFQQIQKQ